MNARTRSLRSCGASNRRKQAENPKRHCHHIRGFKKLLDNEACGTANPNVSFVNVAKEIQCNEVMRALPDEVWQRDDEGEHHTQPKPFTR